MARAIVLKSCLITVVAAVAVFAGYGKSAALAVLAGGLLAAANFRLFSSILRKIVLPGTDPGTGKALGLISFFFRYIFVGAAMLIAIRTGTTPIFFIIGLSAVVAAVFITTAELNRGNI